MKTIQIHVESSNRSKPQVLAPIAMLQGNPQPQRLAIAFHLRHLIAHCSFSS
jgi:hypothetical protein